MRTRDDTSDVRSAARDSLVLSAAVTMKFYCTAGRGTEIFVAEELKEAFGHDIKITSTDGKSYFTVTECHYDMKKKLLSLKTVERIFVEVLHENFQTLDRRGLLTLLHTRLSNKDIWEDCISTLESLTIPSQLNKQQPSSVNGRGRKKPSVNATDKTFGTKKQSTISEAVSEIYTPQTGVSTAMSEVVTETDESDTIIRVPKADTMASEVVTDICIPQTASETCIPHTDCESSIPKLEILANQTETEEKRIIHLGFGTSLSQTDTDICVSEADTNVRVSESGTNMKDHTPMTGSSPANIKHDSVTSEYNPSEKRRKLDGSSIETFRVSCRFSGFARKQLNIQRTSQQMGVLISKLLGWKIDLRHPRYEVNIYLSDDTFTVGIPVTHVPLSKRAYIKHCGLRTPVAWIMAKLLEIGQGDVVLDPMCGCGTILVEASQICQNAVYIGMDKDISQLSLAAENRCNNPKDHIMSLIHGDVRHTPLPDNSVDGVVTDAPFGQNHLVDGNLHEFYYQILIELARVVKPGGKIVLLTSSAVAHFVTQVCSGTINSQFKHLVTKYEKVQKQVDNCLCNTTSEEREDVNEMDMKDDSSKYSNNDIDWPHSIAHLSFSLKATHSVKLGETEGCIFVIQNSEKLKHC